MSTQSAPLLHEIKPQGFKGLSTHENQVMRYVGNADTVLVPDGVTGIAENAFENCLTLQSITIPDAVSVIGLSAFSGCVNLRSVVIGKGLQWLYPLTFEGCGKTIGSTVNRAIIAPRTPMASMCSGLLSSEIALSWTTHEAFFGCAEKSLVFDGNERCDENQSQ